MSGFPWAICVKMGKSFRMEAKSSCRSGASVFTSDRRFLLHGGGDRRPERLGWNPLEHGLEESLDDHALRVRAGKPAGPEVVELILVHLPHGGAVRAADVVRLDLEAGDGIRARLLRKEQVPVRLVGVRALSVLVHLDQPLIDHAGPVPERALEEKVADRMPHVVVLEGVEIEMLRTVPEVASRELDLAPLAVQMHLEVRLRELSAERGVGPVEAGFAAHAHALRAEVMDVSGPALKRGQMELGALGQCDFGRADVHALSGLPVRDVLLDDRGVRTWGERQNHVWEGPEIGRLPREEKLDWP